jgi:hypothetical protein
LIETFSQKRVALFGAPRWQPPPSIVNKAEAFARSFETPEDVAAIAPTMELALREKRGSDGGDVTDPSYAFSVWVQRFSGLREELAGIKQPPGPGKFCSDHADGQRRGERVRKENFREGCPECRRLGGWRNGKDRDITVGWAPPSGDYGPPGNQKL